MTRADFAKAVGMTEMGIWELEHGKNYPAPATVKAIAALTEWSVEETGAFILSLPDQPTTYHVEAFDGGETRPSGSGALGTKKVERPVVGESGEGDEPEHVDHHEVG